MRLLYTENLTIHADPVLPSILLAGVVETCRDALVMTLLHSIPWLYLTLLHSNMAVLENKE